MQGTSGIPKFSRYNLGRVCHRTMEEWRMMATAATTMHINANQFDKRLPSAAILPSVILPSSTKTRKFGQCRPHLPLRRRCFPTSIPV